MNNKSTKIIPLGNRILVKALFEEKTTEYGIIIPDSVSKERPEQGKVVAVGLGRVTDEGKVVAIRVEVGDTILFSKYGPDEIKIDGEDYLIISEDSILAILKNKDYGNSN